MLSVRHFRKAIGAIKRYLNRRVIKWQIARCSGDEEIDVAEAAHIIELALSLAIHRMDLGELPFREVGRQRRVKLKNALILKAKIADQQAAMREIVEYEEELDQRYKL